MITANWRQREDFQNPHIVCSKLIFFCSSSPLPNSEFLSGHGIVKGYDLDKIDLMNDVIIMLKTI